MAIRVDIAELGENQYVEIRDPKFLSWGLQKQITSIVMSDAKTDAQLDVAEMVAVAIIKNGNVLDEDGDPVVFPLTEETVKNCPSVVIEVVTAKFTELKNMKVDRKN
jgi:hypothetical protein